jgi:hypothetical protein
MPTHPIAVYLAKASAMKSAINSIIILITLFPLRTALGARECKLDLDCVLFIENCQKIISIPKINLPKGYAIWNQQEMYIKPGIPDEICTDFRAPIWPKAPIAKCTVGKCIVASKTIESK